MSTIIDTSALIAANHTGEAFGWGASQVTIYGVTGLTADDVTVFSNI